MANVNAASGLRTFENGGVLNIVDGATTSTVLNLTEGSVKWKAAMRERIEWKDRGVIQTPGEGDDTPSDVEFEVFMGSVQSSTELYQLLTKVKSSPDGFVQVFTSVVIKLPGYRGASTGESITFGSCWLMENVEWEPGSGTSWAKMKFKLRSASAPTMATY